MLGFRPRAIARAPSGGYIPRGAPFTAGLQSAFIVTNAPDVRAYGPTVPNLAKPGHFMRLASPSNSANPANYYDDGVDYLLTDGFGNSGFIASGGGLGSYGVGINNTDVPWKPATAGGYAPLTMAIFYNARFVFNRYCAGISYRPAGNGAPFFAIQDNSDGMTLRLSCGTAVETAAGMVTTGNAAPPCVAIATTRAHNDHEIGVRAFRGSNSGGVILGFASTTNSCGTSAANDPTDECMGTAPVNNSYDNGDGTQFSAMFTWDRGMSREEMHAFLLDPFAMIRETVMDPFSSALSGSGPGGLADLLGLRLGLGPSDLGNAAVPLQSGSGIRII